MIQNKSADDRKVEGNLRGEDIVMGVSDMAHILNVVTDLYSDRELAPIREYSTNAVDAHIEAGITAPIEVSTPTHLSPFLTVRDFGVGLSLEDIRTIYSQYGASTKRNTNSQTGMLGLGCKSALTYADQFTVTSVKDGVRIQVVVSRNASGASMKVVDTSDTDEANGTTIIIPAKAHNQFEQKARNFFRFWKPGSVKLNGQEPELLPGAKWVSDDIALIDGSQSYVIMGGVPYAAKIDHGLGYGQSVAAFVGIGKIDFAPSREGLMDTDTTKATLAQVSADTQKHLMAAIKKDIEAATTPRDAIERRRDWNSKVPARFMPKNVLFKGRQIPTSLQTAKDAVLAPVHGRKMTSNQTMLNGISAEVALVSLLVEGWDHASFTATTKKKLMKYVEDKGLTEVRQFLMSPVPVDKSWLTDVPVVQWKDIKEIKLPRNAPNPVTGRIPGSYDIYEDGDFSEGVPGDDIDTSNPVFWMLGRYYDGRNQAGWLKASYPGATLVMLRSGREAKFQRLFPKAQEATTVIRVAFDKWKSGLNKNDAMAWVVQNDYNLSDVTMFDIARVDDPAIKHAISVRNRDLSKLEIKLGEWRMVGMYYSPDEASIKNPLDKYVLLPEGYSLRQLKIGGQMDAVYRYLNCEFAYQTAKAAV